MNSKAVSLALIATVLSILISAPAGGSERIVGTGGVVAVVCTDVYGYKNYSAHYNDHFPLGSTVKVYVEATGKTSRDLSTDEYKPSITFELEGTKPPYPPGQEFTASASSSTLTNHDKSATKRTYAVISFTISSDEDLQGKYRFRITAKDNNAGGRVIGRTPYITVYGEKGATLYPPTDYHYTDLTIEPNPSAVGETVTVRVNVTNLGGKGNWKAEPVYLMVGGAEVASTNTIRLDHNESDEVTFTLDDNVLGETPGNITVRIGDLEGTIIRKEAGNSPASSGWGSKSGGSTPAPCGFEAIGASLILLFVARFIRHL
ncbi:MAG TPA: hypothetical protein ENI32_04570 [Candidatus Syntrophoarchaeum butanivorans]|nr:hypothetical protein [Candidatus Syntrophoarchaeum butanivorans]